MAAMMLTSEVLSLDKLKWDAVLSRFTDVNLYQTWGYGTIQWPIHQLQHFILKDTDQIVAAAQVRVVTLPYLKQVGIAYINCGPVWRVRDRIPNPDIYRKILKSLYFEYVEKRGLLLRVIPSEFDQQQLGLSEILHQAGLQWKSFPYHTLLLDLRYPFEDLRKNFKSKWRNHLNRSEKNELVTSIGSDMELFDKFSQLYEEMIARKGFIANYDIDDFRRIQERLPSKLKLEIFICYSQGVPVAGAIAWVGGETGTTILRATNEQGNKLKAAYFLYWEIVKYMKYHGCLWFDQGGVDPIANPGVYKFKAGIGGKEVNAIGLFEGNQNVLNNVFVYGGEGIKRWWSYRLKRFRQKFVLKKNVSVKKKIRVLHLIAPNSIGGAENVLFGLLKSIDKKKFDPTLVFFSQRGKIISQFQFTCEKIYENFENVELSSAFDLSQLMQLFRIFYTHRPDIVHCHGYKTNILGFLFATVFRAKTISTVHGLYPHNKGYYLHRLGINCLKLFHEIIAVSEKIKEQLIIRGIPDKKIHVIKNVPIPIKAEEDSGLSVFPPDLLVEYGENIKIGFVGRLEEVKGCHVLIDAASILVKRNSKVIFLIFGDGSERNRLEEKVNLMGLNEHIRFFGFVEDVERIYELLDVFVLPSLTEGTPLALLEAMAKGVPVVASDTGGVPEVINNHKNGVLVEPNAVMPLVEGIEKVIYDHQFSEDLKTNAKKTIDDDFNISNWIGIIQHLYMRM